MESIFFFLKWQKFLLVHSLFNLFLLGLYSVVAGKSGLPTCGLSSTDREEAGVAWPRWQQQTSATTNNHILREKPHLFFSETVTERRTNKAVTAPDSHPVLFLNTWKIRETKQGIFLYCSSAPFPQQARTTSINHHRLYMQQNVLLKSKTIVLLFASWYISLPRRWALNLAGFLFFYNTKYSTFISLNNSKVSHPLDIVMSPLLCRKHIQVPEEYS